MSQTDETGLILVKIYVDIFGSVSTMLLGSPSLVIVSMKWFSWYHIDQVKHGDRHI